MIWTALDNVTFNLYQCERYMIRTETVVVRDERDKLIRQLVQVEMDGKAASEQLVKMKNTVRKLKEVSLG